MNVQDIITAQSEIRDVEWITVPGPGGRITEMEVVGAAVIERHHPAGSQLSRRCAVAGVQALQAAAFRRQQEQQRAHAEASGAVIEPRPPVMEAFGGRTQHTRARAWDVQAGPR